VTDYYYVDCEQYREALSARLDDEEGLDDARQPTDVHLTYCAECAEWYDHAALITRRTRTTAVVSWPDVTDAVLARVPASSSARTSRLRVALTAVGAALGLFGLFALVFHEAVGPSAGYDTAAWQLALGVAFVAAAARRSRPTGLVPLLVTFVGVLSWGFVTGLATDHADTGGIVSYALAVAGLVLAVLLDRTPPDQEPHEPVPAGGSAIRIPRQRSADNWPDAMRSIHGVEPTKAA